METFIKLAGLFAGLGLGGTPIVSASWVWIKRQVLGFAGTGLLSAGTLILVISLAAFGDWQVVRVESSEGQWKLELEKAAQRIARLESGYSMIQAENATLKTKIQQIDTIVSVLPGEVNALEERLASIQVSDPEIHKAVVALAEVQSGFLDWGLSVSQVVPIQEQWRVGQLKTFQQTTQTIRNELRQ